jgi:hypothetical protein
VTDGPTPMLVPLFELAADAMGLGEGTRTLELVFVDGRLRRWVVEEDGERVAESAYRLTRYDGRIDWRGLRESVNSG